MPLLGREHPTQPAGINPLDLQMDQSGATSPALLDTSRPASRWSGGLVFLLVLGAALGPQGLAILTPRILDLIDPVIPVALAALGVLAGVELGGMTWSARRVLAAAGTHGLVTAAAVTTGMVLLAPVLGVASTPAWVLAVVAGIGAATSAPFPGGSAPDDPSPRARLRELDDLLPILVGALVLSWMRESSPVAAWLTAQGAAVTLMIALAGWLLLHQPSADTEQRIFTVATLLLVGGAADYLSMSALFCGLVAGVFWRRAGGPAAQSVWRDVTYVRHPLLALLLVVAGARTEISPGVLALGISYALLRAAGTLAGGALGSTMTAGTPGAAEAASDLLSPGMLGVAFALNALRAAGPELAPALAVVVIGTVMSQLFAMVLHRRGTGE